MEGARLARAWRDLGPAPTVAEIQGFHARAKIDLLARSVEGVRALGHHAAAGDARAYGRRLGEVLAHDATQGGDANALAHLVGHVRSGTTRQSLAGLVEAYRRGAVPLGRAKDAFRDALDREGTEWARDQTYLSVS